LFGNSFNAVFFQKKISSLDSKYLYPLERNVVIFFYSRFLDQVSLLTYFSLKHLYLECFSFLLWLFGLFLSDFQSVCLSVSFILFLCLTVCLFLFVSLSDYLSLFLCLSVWLSVSFFLSLCLTVCLFISVSLSYCMCLSFCLSVWLSVCFFASFCLTVCLFLCFFLTVCLYFLYLTFFFIFFAHTLLRRFGHRPKMIVVKEKK